MVKRHATFLKRFVRRSYRQYSSAEQSASGIRVEDVCGRNWNARCFLAIEIENVGFA